MHHSDRIDTIALHVRADLLRDLLEDLFGQIATSDTLVELHELDDIASGCLSSRVTKTASIAIEGLHRREISPADTNDDDRAWHLCKLADQVNGLWHVVDGTIGEQEQDLVLVHAICRLNIVSKLGE